VIPTLILSGFVVGRWWIVPVAIVAWPALLIGTGAEDSGPHLLSADARLNVFERFAGKAADAAYLSITSVALAL
jgi:hypothetical protein